LEGSTIFHLYLEEHHIFGGIKNRKKSENYGLKVKLCMMHHRTGKNAAHKSQKTAKILHAAGQKKFEETHTREEFVKEFGKNYL